MYRLIEPHVAAFGMLRIFVLGCPGSGKTTFARAVAQHLGIPAVHLDRLWWKPGWVPVGIPAFRRSLNEIAQSDRWVMDGHKGAAFDICLPRADAIIVLEQPRLVCLWRALTRTLNYLGRSRPDIGPGCPERFDTGFFRYIWNFRTQTAPAAELAIGRFGRNATLIRLRSDAEIERFVASLRSVRESQPTGAIVRLPAGASTSPRRVTIVSRHDYRTRKKAGIHFIARAFASQGAQVKFISIGFSILSLLRGDPRSFLFRDANRWLIQDDVNCLLWRTALHPFRKGLGALAPITSPWFDRLARSRSTEFDAAVAEADLVLIESGIGPIFIDRIRKLAPAATLGYLVSDLLETVGVHARVQRALKENIDKLDYIALVARGMARAFPGHDDKLVFIPHGIDDDALRRPSASPYWAGMHAVSVGSMLFDLRTIRVLATAFPSVTLHVIGAHRRGRLPPNVVVYPEMPFAETIRYLQHADVGIAAYRRARNAEYLSDSSLKLMQYDALGLPAVCPQFAAAGSSLRFGYEPDDAASIVRAFNAALACGRGPGRQYLSWDDVAKRLTRPHSFADTRLDLAPASGKRAYN
jgi:2-beta-glucuronyltransferase